jgi:hypothetical protein
MDFFTVPTITFRVLYCFFVISHDRRRILHFNVTNHPTSLWIVQQLREAFPFESAPRFLLFDRDAKYGFEVPAAVRSRSLGARFIQREIVLSARSKPSMRSSRCIRGAPRWGSRQPSGRSTPERPSASVFFQPASGLWRSASNTYENQSGATGVRFQA